MLTYATGHGRFAGYLDIQHLPQVSEATIFCGALVGASLGFLWYNCHPAEVFMGDVGSLALGGAIGTIAVLIKQEILLIPIGGVFVIEGLSVMIQVASFKLRGKRVFKMAPLHHHFELLGWKETKVVVRFWIVALIFALVQLNDTEVAVGMVQDLAGKSVAIVGMARSGMAAAEFLWKRGVACHTFR